MLDQYPGSTPVAFHAGCVPRFDPLRPTLRARRDQTLLPQGMSLGRIKTDEVRRRETITGTPKLPEFLIHEIVPAVQIHRGKPS